MAKSNENKQEKLLEEDEIPPLVGKKRELPSPVTPMQSPPKINETSTEKYAVASPTTRAKTHKQAYMDAVLRDSPQALTVANLKSAKFVYGELDSDQQAYLVNKSTTNLKVFCLSGDVADAVLCSTDLKASRSGDTKLDHYMLRIDLGANIESTIDAMHYCVEMLEMSHVMKKLARETRMRQRDIQVVQHCVSSVYYEIFNPAGSFYKPRNVLSRFCFPIIRPGFACPCLTTPLQCHLL